MLAAGALLATGTAAATAAVQPAAAVTVTVGTGTGATLPDDFVGFSFEANILAGTAPSAGNLFQYMKTLGPGVMRPAATSSTPPSGPRRASPARPGRWPR